MGRVFNGGNKLKLTYNAHVRRKNTDCSDGFLFIQME